MPAVLELAIRMKAITTHDLSTKFQIDEEAATALVLQAQREGYLEEIAGTKPRAYRDTGKVYRQPRADTPSARELIVETLWPSIENHQSTLNIDVDLSLQEVKALKDYFRNAESEPLSATLEEYDTDNTKSMEEGQTLKDCEANYAATLMACPVSGEATLITHARCCSKSYVLDRQDSLFFYSRAHLTPRSMKRFEGKGIAQIKGAIEQLIATIQMSDTELRQRYRIAITFGKLQVPNSKPRKRGNPVAKSMLSLIFALLVGIALGAGGLGGRSCHTTHHKTAPQRPTEHAPPRNLAPSEEVQASHHRISKADRGHLLDGLLFKVDRGGAFQVESSLVKVDRGGGRHGDIFRVRQVTWI